MTSDEVFASLLNKAHDKNAVITIGTGTATEVTTAGCTVLRDGQPELFDVIFHASDEQPQNYITVIPKEGSEVIYGVVENQRTEAVILKVSEIDKVIIKIGTVRHEIDDTGHLVKKGNDTAAKILSDFIDEVTKIIVINGRSPNIPALTLIKERVNNLYK
jgi:hypothetical protein